MSLISELMNMKTFSYYRYSLQEKLIELNFFKLIFLTMVFLTLIKWVINYFILSFRVKELYKMKKRLQSSQDYYDMKTDEYEKIKNELHYLQTKQNISDNFEFRLNRFKEHTDQIFKLKSQWDEISEYESELKNKKSQDIRDNIEEIMIDGTYNDPDYLGYEGEEWNMKKLKEKAKYLNIPNFHISSKKAYAYIIRAVEQLSKIENIIEPNYPDGYETEEMCDDDGYETEEMCDDDKDPDWIPDSE